MRPLLMRSVATFRIDTSFPFLAIVTSSGQSKPGLVRREEFGAVEVPGHLGQQQFVGLDDRLRIDSGTANHPDVFLRMSGDQLVETADSSKARAQRSGVSSSARSSLSDGAVRQTRCRWPNP